MKIEGVELTGGASTRMGSDKAGLLVAGRPLGEIVAAELAEVCDPVTICGRAAIPGYAFLADEGEFEGPLVALSRFRPSQPFVFVASCDLVSFSGEIVKFLAGQMGEHEAAIPTVSGHLQPLCALYKAEAFDVARELVSGGEKRVMAWAKGLRHLALPAESLPDPNWVRSVNTPEELRGEY